MRRTTKFTWPFTFETDREFIAATIRRYDETLGVERRCVARWLKAGDRRMAVMHRYQIDRIETARRAGLARLRALASAQEGATPHLAGAYGHAA